MTGPSDRTILALPRAAWGHAKLSAVVSAIYIWAYFGTVYVIAPVQSALLPSVVMSLLFFPHGVRVLTAWLYGWRSVAYLLPGAVLCNLHFAGERAFAPDVLLGTMASLAASPFAFWAVRRSLPQIDTTPGRTRQSTVVAVGFLASVLNLTALKAAYGLEPLEGVVIFIGDTSGLLASMLVVWGVVRVVGR